MAKFQGKLGFVINAESETAPGVYTDTVTEVECSGDVLRNSRRWEGGEKVNDNLVVQNRFSVIASDFALSNLGNMKYLEVYGSKWKITFVEIQRPRIILTVGEVYNG